MKTLTERETLLTGLIVAPATYVWIYAEKAWIALTVAAAMYLLSAHIAPAAIAHLKEHREEYRLIALRLMHSALEKARSRIARGA